MGAVGAIVLVLDLALVVAAILRQRQSNPLFASRWSLADVWFGIQLMLVVLLTAMTPLMALVFLKVPTNEMVAMNTSRALFYFVLPATLIQNLVFFGVPAAWINLKYQLPLRAIGLPPLPRRRDLVAGLLLGLLTMGLSSLVDAGVTAIAQHYRHIPWVHAELQTDQDNGVAGIMHLLPHVGIGGLLFAVLAIGIATPFGEEMVFRGFAFTAFRRRLGVLPGVLLSALIFTLPHSYGFGLIPVFVMGALMAWVYNNTGSLWVTITMHAVNNTISVLLAYFLRHG
jgi:membrane protease YdiL (CAAX protease family)